MSNNPYPFICKNGLVVRHGDTNGITWQEGSGNSADYQKIKLATGCGVLPELTLPDHAGAAHSYLVNDGAGDLSWEAKPDVNTNVFGAYDLQALNTQLNSSTGLYTPRATHLSEGNTTGHNSLVGLGVRQVVWTLSFEADDPNNVGTQTEWNSILYLMCPVPRHDTATAATFPDSFRFQSIWSFEEQDGYNHVEIGHAYSVDPNNVSSAKIYVISGDLANNKWGVPWSNVELRDFDIPTSSPRKMVTVGDLGVKPLEYENSPINFADAGFINVAIFRSTNKTSFTGDFYCHGAKIQWIWSNVP